MSEDPTPKRIPPDEFGHILCYPSFSEKELHKRLIELRSLDIRSIELRGRTLISSYRVLGKGYVGIVVSAITGSGRVALKIRRVDADRTDLRHEAEMLRIANSVGVGPKLLSVTKDFLAMEFIEGPLLPGWLMQVDEEDSARVGKVITDLLEQCCRLDLIGLDHGELSDASKHIIVKGRDEPTILDFESSSTQRRVSNVTSICSYLFLGGHIPKVLSEKSVSAEREILLRALRRYKGRPSKENLEAVISCIRL